MRRNSNRPLRVRLSVAAALLLLVSCGGPKAPESESGTPTAAGPGNPSVAPGATTDQASTATTGGSAASKGGSGSLAGRTGELVSPDNATMVFLYYDLAGIPPPIDNWVESDSRVQFAPPIDKAAKRVEVRAELESGMAAVKGIGAIRLTMNANLSDYDPTYGEFTVRALAPSSVVEFQALGQKVQVKFDNGRTAQVWKVPAADAQLIRDKVGNGVNVTIDAALRITGILPAPGGGTITTVVTEYELREGRNDSILSRIQVPR